MIQEFSITNYRSYKDKQTFSFEATEDDFMEDTQVVEVAPNVRLLKFAVVYGPNASGKSNLLEVLNALHDFWCGKEVASANLCIPFEFNDDIKKKASDFELIFWINKKKFIYRLSAWKGIFDEYLGYYVDDNIIDLKNYHCISKSMFVGDPNEESDEFLNIKKYLIDSIIGNYDLPRFDNLTKTAKKAIVNNKEFFIKYFTDYDIKISNVQQGDDDALQLKHIYSESGNTKESYLPIDLESKGTCALLVLLSLFAVRRGKTNVEKFFSFDELESSLHPALVKKLIIDFTTKDVFDNIQMLITTHSTNILEAVGYDFRADEIWFTNKRDDASTELYSLVEFSELEKVTDFQRAYLNGNFRAIPKFD